MQNATEIWRKLSLPNKLSPGNFVRNKHFKSKMSQDDFKKEDADFFFSDPAYELYTSWVHADEKVEPEDTTTSATYETFLRLCDKIGETHAIEYTNKLLKWFIVDKNYHGLCLEFDTKQPLKYVVGNLDKCLKIYLEVIYSHVELSGQLHRNEIRNLCTDLHRTFNSHWVSKFHDNVCFQVKDTIYVAGNTNRLTKIIKG